MSASKTKRYLVLGILFFLPVIFLLLLIPAKHNYQTLDIIEENVVDLRNGPSDENGGIQFKDHITVVGFLGKNPMENAIATSNLKELIYDKFKGFKRFQIILLAPEGTQNEVSNLRAEINDYDSLEYFHFVFASPSEIMSVYNSLSRDSGLDENLSTNEVFIVDKDLNQRGRIEDKAEKGQKGVRLPLKSYNTIEVAEIKNKMSEDMRVLFTEYRQKRKGDFNSTIRRAQDLTESNVQN